MTLAALQSPPPPSTDTARLRALAEYAILDTEHEDSFDQLAVLAARLCSAPMAVVNFLDAERQWFKAAVGVPMRGREMPTGAGVSGVHWGGASGVGPQEMHQMRQAEEPGRVPGGRTDPVWYVQTMPRREGGGPETETGGR